MGLIGLVLLLQQQMFLVTLIGLRLQITHVFPLFLHQSLHLAFTVSLGIIITDKLSIRHSGVALSLLREVSAAVILSELVGVEVSYFLLFVNGVVGLVVAVAGGIYVVFVGTV